MLMRIIFCHQLVITTGVRIHRTNFDVFTDIILPKFNIRKLNVLCQDLAIASKGLMGSDIMVRSSDATKPDESVLFCAGHGNASDQFIQLLSQNYQNAVLSTWFIIGDKESINKISKLSNIEINKKVLFINAVAGTVEEIYHVNQETVRKKLLGFSSSKGYANNSKPKITVQNRNDFRGLVLTGAMTRGWAPLMYYDPKSYPHVKWKKNKHGDLHAKVSSNLTMGAFADIMRLLEKDLNFTVNMFMKKKNDLGFHKKVNGTFVGWTGHIGDLLAGEVQILALPSVYSKDKFGVLSVMHMMDTLTVGLLVSATAGIENLKWFTYLLPFKKYLWLVLLLMSVIVLFTARGYQILINQNDKEWDLSGLHRHFPAYNTVLLLFIGMPTWVIGKDLSSQSQKLIKRMELIFIFGTLTFMSYKAALTSKLSIQRYILPFPTLEEFYYSDFA